MFWKMKIGSPAEPEEVRAFYNGERSPKGLPTVDATVDFLV